MGDLLYELKGNIFENFITAIVGIIVVVVLVLFSISPDSKMIWNIVRIICILIALYTIITDIYEAFTNRLYLYSKGMVVKKGKKIEEFMIADILNVKMVEKGDDFKITYFLKDNRKVSINSDDYTKFSKVIKEYGKELGYDWSFH